MKVWKLVALAAKGEIGVVGKYIELQDLQSVYESITHAGIANDTAVRIIG